MPRGLEAPVAVTSAARVAAVIRDRPKDSAERAALKPREAKADAVASDFPIQARTDIVTLKASRGEDLAAAEAYYRQLLSFGLHREGLEQNLAHVVALRRKR